MEKFIRICTIVAVVLIALSMLSMVFLIPFQRGLVQLWYSSDALLDLLPIFPLLPFILCVMRLGCLLPLVFTSSRKGSFVLEIVLFLIMMILIPAASSILSPVILNTVLRFFDSNQITAYSIVNSITSYCTIPANWGVCIGYLVCGMRIVSKWMHRHSA